MTSGWRVPAALPFFLDTPKGRRFCMYHAPAHERTCAGAILYVHPFGEEMNMSRRMAALQSRAFAAAGFGVLRIDLHGCGDSEGELKDADWASWKLDLVSATHWLCKHVSASVSLWGLRLGAMLALDTALGGNLDIRRCILWQPVLAGRPYMTQFLRLDIASGMVSSAGKAGGKPNPRDALTRGEMVEAGGYELSPGLVAGIDGVDLSGLRKASFPLHWFELVSDERTPMPAARTRVARAWAEQSIDLRLHAVTGPAFWATKDVSESLALIAETIGMLTGEPA